MKSRRLNMWFSDPEILDLIEKSEKGRPSAVIHDLVLKGILLEKLISGQLILSHDGVNPGQVVSPVATELRGKAPHSEKGVTASPSAKPQPKVKTEPVKRVEPVVQEPVAEGGVVMDLSSLGDLGCDFD